MMSFLGTDAVHFVLSLASAHRPNTSSPPPPVIVSAILVFGLFFAHTWASVQAIYKRVKAWCKLELLREGSGSRLIWSKGGERNCCHFSVFLNTHMSKLSFSPQRLYVSFRDLLIKDRYREYYSNTRYGYGGISPDAKSVPTLHTNGLR